MLVLIFFTPVLADFALRFGPSELFWIAIFGVTVIGTIGSKSVLKGLLSGAFGLWLSTVGYSPVLGVSRFAFSEHLTGGINIVAALIGLFAIPQVFTLLQLARRRGEAGLFGLESHSLLKSFAYNLRRWVALTMGSVVGLYVGHHIATLQIERAGGVKLKYIPTKGGVPAMKMVVGGQVMAGVNNLSDAYRNRERIKILGVADLERNEFLPDTPTLKEQGLEVDDSSVNFRGIMARKGTPQAVIDKLAGGVEAMFGDQRVAGKMQAGGSPMRVIPRAQVKKMWAERQAYLAELLKDLKP